MVKRDSLNNIKHEIEHLISILNSLFMNTTSVLLDRTINKFKENEAEKMDRLIELYQQYLKRYKTFMSRTTEELESEVSIEF